MTNTTGPEKVADYGVVTALRDELTAVLRSLGRVEEVDTGQADIRYYHVARVQCLDGSEQVVVCVQATEMGQLPAAIATANLIKAWKPRHVMLVGIAGGVGDRGAGYGDVVVPQRVHYYEPGKLVRGGRRPRDKSYEASPRLQAAVESQAIDGDAAWARRIETPRPDGQSSAPRILRNEMASGEDVWASLRHPLVKSVLAHRDKVIAIDNEAGAVLKAADESPGRPDVLIVKAVSDLVEGKDDRWRAYAAAAAAAFAVALIEKVGGRWALDGPRGRVAEAKEQIEAARKAIVSSEFDKVPDEYEKAVELAHNTGDATLERDVRAEAAQAYLECYSVASLDERRRARLVSLYEAHVRALESLGLDRAKLAVQRSYVALINKDGQSALECAEEALGLAEEESEVWVDALLCVIKAYWALNRPEDALQLVGLVSQAQSGDRDYGAQFAISATWLEALRRAGRATQDDVQDLCRKVRDLIALHGMPPKRAALSMGPIAAQFNHRESQSEVLLLLECSLELAEQADEPGMCCTIALQAAEVAGILADESKTRLYLGKADAAVEKARNGGEKTGASLWRSWRANWFFGKGRALVRLSENASLGQRAEPLLEEAYDAFQTAQRLVTEHRDQVKGEVGLFLADLNVWLGDTAATLNRVGEAATFFQAARSEAARANAGFWSHRAVPAWLREAESLALSGRLDDATGVVDALLADNSTGGAPRERADQFKDYLQNILRPTRDWFQSGDAIAIASLAKKSLREAISHQFVTVLEWWKEWSGSQDDPGFLSALLDFWGRGGFARVAAAIRARPSDAISVDARSPEEIARWARVLCPLFDTVVVKWKGALESGMVLIPVPDDYGGPGSFGGHGYITTSSAVRDGWHINMGWANPLPREVTRLLSGEALPLVRRGRLVVLPAPLVGCTQTATGWTDNLLEDGFLGGVVAAVDRRPEPLGQQGRPRRLIDLSTVSIPYIDGVPLADMGRVLDETAEWTPLLQSLVVKGLGEDLRIENWESIRALQIDITDACRQLQERLERIARTGGWRVQVAEGSVAAGEQREPGLGSEPVTNQLRSIASGDRGLAPWIPYWRLASVGGWLDWTCPIDNHSTPPDPPQPQELHSWLYPGTGGWGVFLIGVPAK